MCNLRFLLGACASPCGPASAVLSASLRVTRPRLASGCLIEFFKASLALLWSLQEQGEHAGITVQPVVGNLTVGEEADHGKITQRVADGAQFFGIVAEQILAAT